MSRNVAQATSSHYRLSASADALAEPAPLASSLKRLAPVMAGEKRTLVLAFVAVIVTSASSLLAPALIARTVDRSIQTGDFKGVLKSAGLLLCVYLVNLFASYFQTQRMGMVGRRVLFNLRNAIFTKLQQLPLIFFNQNKAGDLISRINNDTDKLNQFFSQALVQFASNLFLMTGAAISLLVLSPRLGSVALLPALGVLILTKILSPWVRRQNRRSLQSTGGLSGEIQESLANFRVIVAFNRVDYFQRKFDESNERNFHASVSAGVAGSLFMPVYGLAHGAAQLVVLAYGIALIGSGHATIGLLIGFLLYVNSFYMPLRQMAAIWSSFQLALAAVDRISEVLALETNLPVVPSEIAQPGSALAFDQVSFSYPGSDRRVLHDATFQLEAGKTYALVGPTGGGKTTTASLMARLYDPVEGRVFLGGQDIRSIDPKERTRKIGFILQEPFLFTGTIRDNIVYGDDGQASCSNEALMKRLAEKNLDRLLARFDHGLDTRIGSDGEGISLGQKQMVAFMRAVLREPEILILDEATANIDTVTEQMLEEILRKLPASTTKVIIAHRLNTIANADEIFFVNSGEIIRAGSMEQALELLRRGARAS